MERAPVVMGRGVVIEGGCGKLIQAPFWAASKPPGQIGAPTAYFLIKRLISRSTRTGSGQAGT